MTVESIAHTDWTVTETSKGKMYANTTNGITGVAYWESPSVFMYVVIVEGETLYDYMYDNDTFSDWNHVSVWSLLESVNHAMYETEQDQIEDAYDSMYLIGEDYDDYGSDDYDYDPYND